MTNVDQFESVFRSADKEPFQPQPVSIGRALIVTDLAAAEADAFAAGIRRFLAGLERRGGGGGTIAWRTVQGNEFHEIPELLELVTQERPDLICTYRHLHSDGWKWPHTLGDHLVVLTQVTPVPVLVVPHPRAGRASAHALEDTNAVMAITDRLTGDHRLVNHAAHFTEPGGRLFLAHVEDEAAFGRFVEVISKIPELNTDTAREAIREQLLKEPRDYIHSCRAALEDAGADITVEEVVTIGRRLSEYTRLIEANALDLLVVNTKDEDQLAMHGLAYPLAVELRQVPLLML